jgi:hypothetical protein
MRKIFLIIAVALLLSSFSVAAFADGAFSLRFRGTGEFAGNQSVSASPITANESVAGGFAIGLDGLFKVMPYLQIGAGLEYQFSRQATYQGVNQGNVQYLPIYAMVRVPFALGPIEPYVVGRIGYGFFSGDSTYTLSGAMSLSGGLFFAVGGGIDYRFGPVSIFAEAAYAVDDATQQILGVNESVSYTGLDLSVGVGFSL